MIAIDANDSCGMIDHDRASSDSESEGWSVNDILRRFGTFYLAKYKDRMSRDQIKTLHALSHCRAEAAGSILYRCN